MKLVKDIFPVRLRKMALLGAFLAAANLFAARTAPWSKEKAWEWYNAQPWIRGCNYMPASAANRVDQWQELAQTVVSSPSRRMPLGRVQETAGFRERRMRQCRNSDLTQ